MTIPTSPTTLAAKGKLETVAVEASDLTILLRRQRDGPELAQEPIREDDLLEIEAELWRDGWLRTGQLDVPFDALSFQVTAQLATEADGRCESLEFNATDPQGQTHHMPLTASDFQDIGTRAALLLRASGALQADDVYYYEILRRQWPSTASDEQPAMTIKTRPVSLRCLRLPLRSLVAQAEAVGKVDEATFPVFYTKDAVLTAQRLACKGADHEPPTETGGVLVGPLCSCPETGELFVVVSDVLEARDAERSSFSLSYTGKTWARIQAVIRAKQSQPNHSAYRIVGQVHGHNFLPGEACCTCEKAAECRLSSVFVSLDDRLWSRAVFNRQPWYLCHIFGFNARGKQVHALFSLRHNRLQQRGFYLLADFDPAQAENGTVVSDNEQEKEN